MNTIFKGKRVGLDRRFVSGNCCILLDRSEPRPPTDAITRAVLASGAPSVKEARASAIRKCSFICRDPHEGQATTIVNLDCRHPISVGRQNRSGGAEIPSAPTSTIST